ncbi:MAG TPA: M28 family metallopeptidase [Woeseiaceae bacterium]|nr:M28 family metallopeptidase [Woeseiaceae bacterium]
MPKLNWILVLLPALLLGACGNDEGRGTAGDETTAERPMDQQQTAAPAEAEPAITADELAEHIKTLSSDEFGGREPSTPGAEKAVEYIAAQFEAAGLEPGIDGGWYQQVPLVSITLDPATTVSIEGLDEPLVLRQGENTVLWTKRVRDQVSLEDSDLVFVGYGVVAPEYDWNDYEGLDVEGKTVVILVNDPGYGTQDPDLFTGNKMTYYGRWTYKYEEAARQGAAGAIVIHETEPAGYPWEVVTGSWTGPQYDLVPENENMDRVKVEGWITHEIADQLFQHIGMSLDAAKQAALQEDFEPIPLEATMSTVLNNTIEKTNSRNVVGVIEGSARPQESVLYMAHWDHLGTDPNLEGDQIYNGAVDNATGVAGLIELAGKFSAGEPPERSVVFLAVTAEESGLLGSKYYANNPAWPLELTAAVINMDAMSPYGKTNDLVVVGYGMNELQGYLERAAAEQGRTLVPEPTPEKGFYFRSDHFNFAKKGVPALYAEAGNDYVEGGTERGEKLEAEYTAERYHKPGDEYDPSWDLSGMVQNLELFYQVGNTIADSNAWPEWLENVSFRAIREKSADQRQGGEQAGGE